VLCLATGDTKSCRTTTDLAVLHVTVAVIVGNTRVAAHATVPLGDDRDCPVPLQVTRTKHRSTTAAGT